MSRSTRKAIIKDRPRNGKKSSLYWRSVRSTQNNAIKSCRNFEELEIPNEKTIINDYNYCDYIIDHEFDRYISRYQTREDNEKDRKKYSRIN